MLAPTFDVVTTTVYLSNDAMALTLQGSTKKLEKGIMDVKGFSSVGNRMWDEWEKENRETS
jgi:hypothetical protein